ncbi:hypothetical protein RR48_09667 [Papilio machaon]|uniref:Uncharacterized protein n=1 Tax=Papilio machaon TaxID=76193 RepID=A0A194RE50_PAPMA|nr:hypothetical protein RR48_09667 [Papilio machaon]
MRFEISDLIMANPMNGVSHLFDEAQTDTTAEKAKANKYRGLGSEYEFVPFGVETLGPWGPSARRLFKETAKRLVDITGDRRAGSYLGQRISLAIQRVDAAIFGTLPKGIPFNDIF